MQVSNTPTENLIVGISDARISDDPAATVVTYALGSCLGLAVYDPARKLGGILHSLLPLSTAFLDKAKQNPYMFVDTGVTMFLNDFFSRGGVKENMIVTVSGCGVMQDASGHFNIGQRNYTVLRKILWKNNILIANELISGSDPKTMSLAIGTGRVLLKVNNELIEL